MTAYDFIIASIAGAIGLFSPARANEYLKAHHSLKERAYTAAKSTGPNSLWKPKSTSAEAEIKAGWRKVTDRARDLERNNCYIKGFIRRFIASTVGEGMYPKSKVLLPSGKIDQALAKEIEEAWEAWAESAGSNGDGFETIQRQVAYHLIMDGEILIHKVSAPGQPLALELLEADYLDTSKDGNTGSGRVTSGVELDRWGKPIAYHLFQAHPSEYMTSSVRVPASEILHVFNRERASQVRGICPWASVIDEIFGTVEYMDSTLVVARLATAFGVVVTTPNPEDFMPSNPATLGSDEADTALQYISPGAVHYLRPGESASTIKPEQPAGVYPEYVRSRLRGASVGAGVSYESFSNDYSQATYSSARQAMIQERQMFRLASSIIDSKLNLPIFRWFLEHAQAFGMLSLPGYEKNPRPFWRVQFSRPRQEWIDPQKEAAAAKERLAIGLETLTELAESEGRDLDQVFETRANEVAKMKALGIFQVDPSADVTKAVVENETMPGKEEENV